MEEQRKYAILFASTENTFNASGNQCGPSVFKNSFTASNELPCGLASCATLVTDNSTSTTPLDAAATNRCLRERSCSARS